MPFGRFYLVIRNFKLIKVILNYSKSFFFIYTFELISKSHVEIAKQDEMSTIRICICI